MNIYRISNLLLYLCDDMKQNLIIQDMTDGPITRSLIRFALPLMAGNLLQQGYNLVDTIIVGKYLGADALAAVGTSYTLLIFITSIFIGICMGCGTVLSICFGAGDKEGMKTCQHASVWIIGLVTLILTSLTQSMLPSILSWLHIPANLMDLSETYIGIVCIGMIFTAIYNFYAFSLRAIGNSLVPLYFLGIASLLNILFDLLFVILLHMSVDGIAIATVMAQALAAVGLAVYTHHRFPLLRLTKRTWHLPNRKSIRTIGIYSFLTCLQQSIMNFGILMVQGLVNSFGVRVMAAFAAGVKIDTLAYMPVQDFGNAFSTFIAQNHGGGKHNRIRRGIQVGWIITTIFSISISLLVYFTAPWLMKIFVDQSETEILTIGTHYLRIEGSFYIGIGYLFLLYGFYRAVARPGMSLILTVISLGTRVSLAYLLSAIPWIGVDGIWWAIPIGWILADGVGCFYIRSTLKTPLH